MIWKNVYNNSVHEKIRAMNGLGGRKTANNTAGPYTDTASPSKQSVDISFEVACVDYGAVGADAAVSKSR